MREHLSVRVALGGGGVSCTVLQEPIWHNVLCLNGYVSITHLLSGKQLNNFDCIYISDRIVGIMQVEFCMEGYAMNKGKHLTEDERYQIMYGIDKGKSFKQLGKEIGRDCTTISKEIRARRIFKQSGAFGNMFNDCKHRRECLETDLCHEPSCRRKSCKRCTKMRCYKLCESYGKEVCKKREKPPYCCNGCDTRSKCSLEKALYVARSAHDEYKTLLGESRSGICADESEIARLDEYISPLLKNGQSVHNILTHSSGNVMWSEKTIYKYVDMGLFNAGNLDLRRKVRFRPRKSKHESFKVDKVCRIGRTLDDYQKYHIENPDIHVVEMDTVHGKVGGKCLLTLQFEKANFMLAYILDACTSDEVRKIFAYLRDTLGTVLYSKLFPILIGDNGPEFSNPLSIEFDDKGEGVSRIFYCDPGRSDQKGALERNHELLRYVIPKGIPMDSYTQQDISLMTDHINSYSRPMLMERSPYQTFEFFYGGEALKKLGANLIPHDKIILRPSLLKK